MVNVPLTFWPKVVTMPMQATKIKASIIAYSTAVGPSSFLKNRRDFARKEFNAKISFLKGRRLKRHRRSRNGPNRMPPNGDCHNDAVLSGGSQMWAILFAAF